jgi:hypothetical protein
VNIARRLTYVSVLCLLLGCSREATAPEKDVAGAVPAPLSAPPAAVTPSVATPPSWYVFRIKSLQKVTFSGDRLSAVVEGVTMGDRTFRVKLVWAEVFKESHPRAVERWSRESKADFDAGVPYVIAGKVVSRDPLTIEPDTVVSHALHFGAPPENVY